MGASEASGPVEHFQEKVWPAEGHCIGRAAPAWQMGRCTGAGGWRRSADESSHRRRELFPLTLGGPGWLENCGE